MRRADAIECDQIGLETLKQDAVWLKRATEVVAVAQRYLAVDCRQERPSVPLVLADDSFVGHRFEHAQKRTAIRIVAGQQGDLGDPFGDAATDAVDSLTTAKVKDLLKYAEKVLQEIRALCAD